MTLGKCLSSLGVTKFIPGLYANHIHCLSRAGVKFQQKWQEELSLLCELCRLCTKATAPLVS